jgi:hypothetical protein
MIVEIVRALNGIASAVNESTKQMKEMSDNVNLLYKLLDGVVHGEDSITIYKKGDH